MGFLKRTRLKRTCLSKNGKICNKGYYYQYSFSNQGRKYLRWMINEEPVQALAFTTVIDESLPHLAEDTRKMITGCLQARELARYRGPNLALRTVGVAAILALPELSRKLTKVASENLELNNDKRHLTEVISDLKGKKEKLERQVEDLEQRLTKQDVETVQIMKNYTEQLLNEIRVSNASSAVLETYKLYTTAYKSLSMALSRALAISNPTHGLKMVEFCFSQQNHAFARAEQQAMAAEFALNESSHLR
jgi:hypothetical protein